MNEHFSLDNADRIDDFIESLVAIVVGNPPPLPHPGSQAQWRTTMRPEHGRGIEFEAGAALRDLLDRGSTQDELYAIARGIAMQTILHVLNLMDREGELGGEFYSAIDALRHSDSPDGPGSD